MLNYTNYHDLTCVHFSSCAVPTPPTNVSPEPGCNSAEVTWGASMFMSETIQNYSVMYQRMNGGNLVTTSTSSASITLQNLQPGAMYAVSVAGINSCGGISEFSNTTFQLQGNFKFICVLLSLQPTSTA